MNGRLFDTKAAQESRARGAEHAYTHSSTSLKHETINEIEVIREALGLLIPGKEKGLSVRGELYRSALAALDDVQTRLASAQAQGNDPWCNKCANEEMRKALSEISKAEQSVTYSMVKNGESDFAERMTIQSMLRHCGNIARDAITRIEPQL